MKVSIKLEQLLTNPNFVRLYYDIKGLVLLNDELVLQSNDFDKLLTNTKEEQVIQQTNWKEPTFDFIKWAKEHPNSSLALEFYQDKKTFEGDSLHTVSIIVNKGIVFHSPCSLDHLTVEF